MQSIEESSEIQIHLEVTAPHLDQSAIHVDYFSDEGYGQNDIEGIEYQYAFSPLTEKESFSTYYEKCGGMMVTGRKKVDNTLVSLSSHYDPHKILWMFPDNFQTSLNNNLIHVRSECVAGSIDVVLFGGCYAISKNKVLQSYASNYIIMTISVADQIEKVLDITPRIVAPKFIPQTHNNAYFFPDKQALVITFPEMTFPEKKILSVDEIKTWKS